MLPRALLLLTLLMTALFSPVSWGETVDWPHFKVRFLMPDGRIVDSGNHNISHTEGQGFGMLFALQANDKPAFDAIWNWTRDNLRNPQNGLFYWQFNPVASDPVADKNNATDGDTLIAWALMQAADKWREPGYQQASDAIQAALIKSMVINYAGYTVMLPGEKGFKRQNGIVLNPSYFVLPAWQDFARHTHLAVWQKLIADSQRLLAKMQFGSPHLPSDWVYLSAQGNTSPAKAWPARSSYDAIRVPLYLWWADPANSNLAVWHQWWSQTDREHTPAWVDVSNNQRAPYMMAGGLLAVRDLVMEDASLSGDVAVTAGDDYYSASLKLLVAIARNAHH
ncbi:endoglucanase [Shimwellia pseudoproteus]|uniref:glycosyl hydrolase family 8 n=1 Tax=Shimwellia pseudoproteus TaxID=570012 RepID=UPI0018EAF6D1|nr:glycosyl hydrolase family 8 [Shimwellia pseudoproteus]MBJ3815823.1 endoglucanase [Shimwellia pseudoproteus]